MKKIDKILKSRVVDWKIKEKLRKGESCFTCRFGEDDSKGGWCFYYMDNPPFNHIPLWFPDLLVCGKYKIR